MAESVDVRPIAPGPGGPYYPPLPPPPPARGGGGRGCLVFLVFLFAGIAAVSLAVATVAAGRGRMGGGRMQRPEPLAERYHSGDGDAKIALVHVSGVIVDELAGPFGIVDRPVERLRRELEQAAADGDVRAIVVRVDSPGGTIEASDRIHKHLVDWKKRTGKPIVVSMGGVAASGGYYVSAPADRILAEPTTITGSIGVILTSFNFAGLLQKIGVQGITIKSGENKDLLNPFETDPARIERHKAILQRAIDDAYGRFVSVVVDGRSRAGLTREEALALADGRILVAEEARASKLVDAVGYLEDAVAAARQLSGVGEATVFTYVRAPGLLDILLGGAAEGVAPLGGPASSFGAGGAPRGAAPAFRLEVDPARLLELETPRLMYLFRP